METFSFFLLSLYWEFSGYYLKVSFYRVKKEAKTIAQNLQREVGDV